MISIPCKIFPPLTLPTGHGSTREKIRSATSDQLLELVENTRVPPAFAHFLFHSLQRIGDGKGLLIGPIGGWRIIDIDNLQHPGSYGYVLSPKSVWIP